MLQLFNSSSDNNVVLQKQKKNASCRKKVAPNMHCKIFRRLYHSESIEHSRLNSCGLEQEKCWSQGSWIPILYLILYLPKGGYGISPHEIPRNLGEISRNFVKLLFCEFSAKFCFHEIFFPISRALCFSIEHIKLKLLLFSKLYLNIAIRNFDKISEHFAKLQNFGEISYPPLFT
jgi:hypothetical protein